MTTDTEEVVVADTSEADLEAGFNTAMGVEEPPVVEEKKVEEVVEEPKVEEPKQEEPAEETVTLNQSEIKSLLGKLEDLDKLKASQRDLYGRLGTVTERLQKQTEVGGPIEISDEDLASLNEYGDIKVGLKEALAKVLSKARGGQQAPVDLAPIESKFQAQEAMLIEREKKLEMKVLTSMHRDWRQVTQSEEFGLWLQTQPEDYRQKINSSWDAEEIGSALDSFKAVQAEKTKPAVKAENKARRLEAAVLPSGNAVEAPAISEQDAFNAGFAKATGRAYR